jgi:hypothetical protein
LRELADMNLTRRFLGLLDLDAFAVAVDPFVRNANDELLLRHHYAYRDVSLNHR